MMSISQSFYNLPGTLQVIQIHELVTSIKIKKKNSWTNIKVVVRNGLLKPVEKKNLWLKFQLVELPTSDLYNDLWNDPWGAILEGRKQSLFDSIFRNNGNMLKGKNSLRSANFVIQGSFNCVNYGVFHFIMRGYETV